jgi:ribosomal protein L37AE/L43A
MAAITPSNMEQEYFAKQQLEQLKKLAEERAATEKAEERKRRQELHFMRCPKCGDKLDEVKFRDVKIDKCSGCGGIYLDAGELEAILKNEDATLMSRVLSVFK